MQRIQGAVESFISSFTDGDEDTVHALGPHGQVASGAQCDSKEIHTSPPTVVKTKETALDTTNSACIMQFGLQLRVFSDELGKLLLLAAQLKQQQLNPLAAVPLCPWLMIPRITAIQTRWSSFKHAVCSVWEVGQGSTESDLDHSGSSESGGGCDTCYSYVHTACQRTTAVLTAFWCAFVAPLFVSRTELLASRLRLAFKVALATVLASLFELASVPENASLELRSSVFAFGFWAALTAALVMESGAGASYLRGMNRLLGTMIGAAAGMCVLCI